MPDRLIGAPSSVIENDRKEAEKNKTIDPTDGTMVTYNDRWHPAGNNTTDVVRQTRKTVIDPETGKVTVSVSTSGDAAVLSGFATANGTAGVMSMSGAPSNKTTVNGGKTSLTGGTITNTNSPETNTNADANVAGVTADANAAAGTP
jgi:hypothetical protein